MRLEILCLGSELLKDKINQHSNLIAQKLFDIGLLVSQVSIVGDHANDIETSFKGALERSNVVIICGGLGPTFDDLTRECVSKVLHRPLVFSSRILKQIRSQFSLVNRRMPQENERQAYTISGARVLLNSVGTAPGQIIPYKNKTVILLPGPARELLPMLEGVVCSYLKKKYSQKLVQSLVLHIHGFPESEIDEKIQPVLQRHWNAKGMKVTFGILAHQAIVDIKATVEGRNAVQVRHWLQNIEEAFKNILGDRIYGKNEETLESVVGQLLFKRKETLSIAESCTGGSLADQITNIPGSSVYFKEGVVAYSDESKRNLLGVSRAILKRYGAVSESTAKAMALGILKRSGSDWAVSITGIAGPGGGTVAKPVGLVCFAIASKKGVQSWIKQFSGTRREIKSKASLMALTLLRQSLMG
jgi:nicotinamide-nucleotide amidase